MAGLFGTLKSLFGGEAKPSQEQELAPDAFAQIRQKIHLGFFQQLFHTNLHVSLVNNRRIAELDAIAEKLLKDSAYRQAHTPRLPAVVPQLLRSLRDRSSSGETFARLIQQDPSLAAAVLRMAGNTFFNPNGAAIDSFERAVLILGTDGLRTLLCTTVMKPIIQHAESKEHNFSKHIWSHSLRSGISAQLLAQSRGLDEFKAYLLGLVQVIGDITLYGELANIKFASADEKANAFYYLHGRYSPILSARIVAEWDLDESLIAPIKEAKRPKTELGVLLQQALVIAEALHLEARDKFSAQQRQQLFAAIDAPPQLWNQIQQAYASLSD